MASFDENGKYIKTNWKAGDKITATKLNKIEESIEAVNDNDISRHVEADARLDALEAKDVAHDKEFTNVKNTIANNKAAAELGDYEINSRMTFLENELNEGIEEVNNVASTVDGKIATAEANMTTQVNQGKADMEAMVAEVEADLEGLHAKDEEISEQLEHIENISTYISVKNFGAKGDGATDDTQAIQDTINSAKNSGGTIFFPKGEYLISDNLRYEGLKKSISILGDSRESVILWNGGDDGVINDFSNIKNAELKITFSNMKFKKNNTSSNLVFFKSDEAENTYLVNLTFNDNYFEKIDTILDIYKETDQVIFENNYVLLYQNGIRAKNGTCSNIHITKNHFRGGYPGSIALYHEGGANITFDQNTVQSGSNNLTAVNISNVNTFTVRSTYYESGYDDIVTADSYPFIVNNSRNGVIEHNTIHGNSKDIITLNGCTSVIIGPNAHSMSGTYPRKFLVVSECTAIRVTGLLEGSTWGRPKDAIEGKVDFMIDKVHNGTYFTRSIIPMVSDLSYVNINAFELVTLLSNISGANLFLVQNKVEKKHVMGIIINGQIAVLSGSEDNVLNVKIENDALMVENNVSATRTIYYSFLKLM